MFDGGATGEDVKCRNILYILSRGILYTGVDGLRVCSWKEKT
jgi:hypothetical protein